MVGMGEIEIYPNPLYNKVAPSFSDLYESCSAPA
jgi:hypothetical protein